MMNKVVFVIGLLLSCLAQAEIKPETIGKINTLPVPYPSDWIIAHDAAFFHMLEGKMVVLDTSAETLGAQYKGMFNNSFIGQFIQSSKRPEMYVGESFHARGNRGERTDVLTIYDKATLAPIDEILLPGGKLIKSMPEKQSIALIDDERLLLISNFTPASSVTVVDLVERKILSEVQTPGCALIYPTGERGFSSLCSNGAMLSVQLDQNGQVAEENRTEVFFDTNKSTLFEKSAIINGIAYFPGLAGQVQPIDLRKNKPKVLKQWSLTSDEERAQGWRPGGWQLLGADDSGRMYILMNPKGFNGSHKDGGPEVWVFNVNKGKRIQRIKLNSWGISLALTSGKNPRLVITTPEMNLEVYEAKTGQFIRTLSDFGQETPFVVYPAK